MMSSSDGRRVVESTRAVRSAALVAVLLCLLTTGCGQKKPSPVVAQASVAVWQMATSLAEQTAEAAPGPSPVQEAKPLAAERSHQKNRVDDRYGPGDLGPRILFHKSEIVEVPLQRLEMRLQEVSRQEDVDFPQGRARPVAPAGRDGREEGAETDSASSDTANHEDKVQENAKGASPAARADARKPRPVRVWDVREPVDAHSMTPLAPAEVDTRAYLAQLGIHSIYDLSPNAHLLALPHVQRPGVSPWRGPGSRAGVGRIRPGGTLSPQQWEVMLQEAGRLFGLEPRFIAAVIQVESNFDHMAVSPAGAQGAMQIMPGTQVQLGLKDPFDVRANIHAGCAFLRELLVKYGTPELALAAYNAGPGAVDKYRGIPPYAETQKYVRKIMALWQGENSAVDTTAHSGETARKKMRSPVPPTKVRQNRDAHSVRHGPKEKNTRRPQKNLRQSKRRKPQKN